VADETASTRDLVRWGEALAAIARTGLGFTESLYERERFEEILNVAGEIRAAAATALARDGQPGSHEDAAGYVQEWLKAVGSGVPGYVTPKVAVGAVVGNDDGEILLVQRGDSGVWLYPTGWADVGYSAAEVAVKEVREETGIEVEVVRLIMVLDGLRIGITQIPLYSLVFQLRPTGGQLQAHPLECRAVGWFAESNLPSPLAGAGLWKEHAFKAIRNEAVEVLFDRPRQPVWRKPEPDADTATEGDAQPANDGQPSRDSQPAGGVQSSGSVQS
jgi:ADP-ribose pyrophosphatase YjhB (NUDIX family)